MSCLRDNSKNRVITHLLKFFLILPNWMVVHLFKVFDMTCYPFNPDDTTWIGVQPSLRWDFHKLENMILENTLLR